VSDDDAGDDGRDDGEDVSRGGTPAPLSAFRGFTKLAALLPHSA